MFGYRYNPMVPIPLPELGANSAPARRKSAVAELCFGQQRLRRRVMSADERFVMEQIREGFDVFLHDGDMAFGAIRQVSAGALGIYVENAGDFTVSREAVRDVHDGKVVLDGDRLEPRLQDAIRKARQAEDPRIADRPIPT
jgi:hypothetical protein